MLSKRIIPCLDIKDGRTVKGINFEELRDAGNPVELAVRYAREGADEIVFLDISATNEKRKTLVSLVSEIAANLNIPFTVGGGISSVEDVSALLCAGADKISVNSSVLSDPELTNKLADKFGSQCVVVAIDAKCIDGKWIVHSNGGKKSTGKDLFEWAKQVQQNGAGEILFTSMDHDGTKNGFAIDPLLALNEFLTIPVIASGGAGSASHFVEVFLEGKADAALAASIFHFGEVSIPRLKKILSENNIPVRAPEQITQSF